MGFQLSVDAAISAMDFRVQEGAVAAKWASADFQIQEEVEAATTHYSNSHCILEGAEGHLDLNCW